MDRVRFLALLCVLLSAAACTETEAPISGDSPTEKPPLYLSLSVTTKHDQQEKPPALHVKCEIREKDARKGVLAPCEANLPEGQLFYSEIQFVLDAGAKAGCHRIIFAPYYHRASMSNAFKPGWGGTQVDCSTTNLFDTPLECFNGPGVLVPDFPRYSFVYQALDVSNKLEFKVPSANAGQRRQFSNRWVASDLNPSLRSQNLVVGDGSDGYVANSYQGYSARCVDRYEELLYGFTLTINEINSTGSGQNQVDDWTSMQPAP